MAFEVFGAGAVQTAYVSYLALDITPNSLTLLWPTTYVDAPYTDPSTGISFDILAASMDVTTPVFNVNTITLPNATQSGVGQNFIITNVGLADFNLLTSDDALLQVVVPGISYWVQLTDNSTVEGTWTVIVFGAGTSDANAALLAGNGLTAIGSKLNTNIPVISTNIIPVLDTTDRAKLIIWTGGADTIPLPAIGDVPAGYYLSFNNQGSAAINITPGEPITTIDGNSDISVAVGQSLSITSNGANWWTLGFGQNQFSVISSLTLDVSASVDVTLTNVQASSIIQNYTGALTADIVVFFPNNVNYWYINNATTGAFDLAVQLAGPLGGFYIVAQGTKQIFYSNGLSMFPLPTGLQLADGSAAAPSAAFSDGASIGTGMFKVPGVPPSIGFSIGGDLSALVQNDGSGIGAVAAVSANGTELQIISSDAAASINYNNVAAIAFPFADAGTVIIPVGPILIPDGSVAAPSYAFSSTPTTGIFRGPFGSLDISIGGADSAHIDHSGTVGSVSAISSNGRGLSLNSDNVTGSISYANTDAIVLSNTGTVTLPVGPLTLTTGQIRVPNGSVAAPSYAFSGSTNTGMFRNPAVPSVDFSIGGVLAGGFSTTGTSGGVSAIASNATALEIRSNTGTGSIIYNSINAISIDAAGAVTFPAAPLDIASGGTNAITQQQAIINLMPFGTTGDIIYFDGTDWVVLPISGDGRVLTVVGGLPSWA